MAYLTRQLVSLFVLTCLLVALVCVNAQSASAQDQNGAPAASASPPMPPSPPGMAKPVHQRNKHHKIKPHHEAKLHHYQANAHHQKAKTREPRSPVPESLGSPTP